MEIKIMPKARISCRAGLAGLAALFGLLLGGCDLLPPQPARFNAYQGLMPEGGQPPQAAERPPIVGRGRSIAIVVSNSTEEQFRYIETVLRNLRTNPIHMYRPDVEERGRPTYFSGQIVDRFRQRFGRVELAADFRAATVGNFDYIALVDLGIRKPTSFGREYAYDINVDLLTPRLERIVSLEGHGLDHNYCPGFECGYATDMRAMQPALDQFTAALERAVR